jgi:hypothetical protein
MNGQAGKGDTYRPVNNKVYGDNYDFIFRRNANGSAPDKAPVKVCTCGLRGSRHDDACPFRPAQAAREAGK